MTLNKKINIRLTGAVVLILVLAGAYLKPLSHILWYHETHEPVFRFAADYWHHTLHTEGTALGMLTYATRFVVQFFAWPVIGAAMMGCLIVLFGLGVALVLKRLPYRLGDLAGILAALELFFCTAQADFRLQWVVGLAAVGVLLAAASMLIPEKKAADAASPSKRTGYFFSAAIVLLFIYGYGRFIKTYNYAERAMLTCQQAAEEGEWDHAIEIADRYMQRHNPNRLLLYFRALAYAHRADGTLLQHVAEVQNPWGPAALYFPWRGDSRETEYGHYFAEAVGLTNEALRWEFEAMAVWGETRPHLQNLYRYYTEIGRTDVAEKFGRLLDQTLVGRQSLPASPDGMTSATLQTTDISALSDSTAPRASFTNVENMIPNLRHVLQYDSTSTTAATAREYLRVLLAYESLRKK